MQTYLGRNAINNILAQAVNTTSSGLAHDFRYSPNVSVCHDSSRVCHTLTRAGEMVADMLFVKVLHGELDVGEGTGSDVLVDGGRVGVWDGLRGEHKLSQSCSWDT